MAGQARLGLPDFGVGVGLRVPHYGEILRQRPEVDFFEIISENFLVPGGKPRHHLERFLENYRLLPHGVSLSIAGPEAPNSDYLRELKRLVKKLASPWVSDHFCWGSAGGLHLHDLLPIPYTREAVSRVVERARTVQDFLETRFALENTSSYLTYRSSTLSEWEFISEIAERADIGLLFDVNNVYVSAYNHGFDPMQFIDALPHQRIVQIHLAGHTNLGKYIIDTHRGPIIPDVWELYRYTIERVGPVSTLIEWDEDIPSLDVLLKEAQTARLVRDTALENRASQSGARPVSMGTFPGASIPLSSAQAALFHGGPRETPREELGPLLP